MVRRRGGGEKKQTKEAEHQARETMEGDKGTRDRTFLLMFFFCFRFCFLQMSFFPLLFSVYAVIIFHW